MEWKQKKFNELTTKELFQIYQFRSQVFTVGQNRIYQDPDENDLVTTHVFAINNDDVVAYARIFIEDNFVTFGRVATSPSYRGQGLGQQLMDIVMQAIQQNYPKKPIEIHAQDYVEGFYQKFGFTSQGAPVQIAGTPHIKMTHPAM